MRISPEPPRVAQAPFRPLYSDLTAPAEMLGADLTPPSGRPWDELSRQFVASGWPTQCTLQPGQEAAHAVAAVRYLRRKPGSGRLAGNLNRSLRGVSWMMSWRRLMETSASGPVSSVHGRHTGVSAPALLTEHGL